MHTYACGYIEKPLEAKETTNNKLNSMHIWRRHRDLNPGHIGGRGVISPLDGWKRLHKSRADNIQNRELS